MLHVITPPDLRSEGIARTAEAAKARKNKKRKTPKFCKEYLAGQCSHVIRVTLSALNRCTLCESNGAQAKRIVRGDRNLERRDQRGD